MNHLLRELAPLTPATWAMVDDEAKARLSPALGARRLVDFTGPLGWEHSATNLGRVGPVAAAPTDGIIAQPRKVLPLAELRADFSLARSELDAATRGAVDVDLTALDEAALRIASVENAAIFNGWDDLGITGISEATPLDPVPLGDDPSRFAIRVAEAVAALKNGGIGGPYGLAVGESAWVNAFGGNDAGGAQLLAHLRTILDGPVQWTPGIDSAVVLSLRGGDFILESGQDLVVGYSSHSAERVDLYLQETFSFRVGTPEAAVRLS